MPDGVRSGAAPAVSVVVPVRGPAPWLGEALESLAADGAEVEVLVVEDGSREQQEAALRRRHPGASLLALPPVGRSQARNVGVESARAELVAFLDADDVSLPGRLRRQTETLERAPAASLCFGGVVKVDGSGAEVAAETAREERRRKALLERGLTYESLLVDCPIYTSATMVRRSRFLAAGGYRREVDAFEDLDLYLRLALQDGLVACEGPPVAQHRLHEGNTSVADLFAGSARVARLHLEAGAPSRRAHRLLLLRELDALWGLGDRASVRGRALHALRAEPLLLAQPAYLRRLAASLVPEPLLAPLARLRR